MNNMTDNQNKNYMTINEVSEYLSISRSAAYDLTHRSDFPVCRFGGNIRVPKDALLAWVESKTRISAELRAMMRAS